LGISNNFGFIGLSKIWHKYKNKTYVWFSSSISYIQTKHNSILKLRNKWKQQVIQCKKIGCCFTGWGGINSKSKGCSRSVNLSRCNNSKRKSIGNFNKFDFKFVFFSNTCTLSKNDQSFPQSYSWMSSSCGNSFSWPSWIPSLIKNSNFKSINWKNMLFICVIFKVRICCRFWRQGYFAPNKEQKPNLKKFHKN